MADQPRRIQLRRTKGFNLQRESLALNGLPAVKVDRSTQWGNVYRVGMYKNFTAADAVEAFRYRLKENIHLDARWIMEHIHELRKKNLACWCRLCQAHASGKPLGVVCPDCAPCHVDVYGDILLSAIGSDTSATPGTLSNTGLRLMANSVNGTVFVRCAGNSGSSR